MKKALLSLTTIGIVSVTAIGLSSAFFSDIEKSTGNIFQAGSLDLKINSQDNPSAIIDVDDLKPGDDVIEEKILKVIDNPAEVWIHIKDLVSGQGEQTEPEELEEILSGEKHDIENYLTYNLKVGNEVIIHFGNEILLHDAVSCWIPLGEFPALDPVTVEQSFHFDESVTDWAQGDTLTFTEEFYASQINDPSGPPDLGTGRFWSSELNKCVSDFTGKHSVVFTCTSGCSGTYPHTMNVTSMNLSTGDFSGTGSYDPNPAYTWNVTGNTTGSSIYFHILYTGLNPGYTVDGTGTIEEDGTSSGTAFSSSGQTFTWEVN